MVNIKLKVLDKGRIVEEQLLRVLQRHEDYIANDTTSDSAIAELIGEAPSGSKQGSGMLKDIADLQNGKANSSHTHTLSNVSDLTTVEAVVTYADESTETILLVKQVVEDSESVGE